VLKINEHGNGTELVNCLTAFMKLECIMEVIHRSGYV